VRLVGGAIVDPELADLDARWSRRSEIEAALVAWLADRPASESVEILAAGGVPAGMSSPASVLRRDPHLNARGFFRHVPYPALGDLMLLGAPLRFGPGSERPDVMAPPKLGEHDELVYGRRDPVGAAR
jgi:crotonobetainyl-CoA:carnitine CoA-transferase CaiB-like acyl-CoA transferase